MIGARAARLAAWARAAITLAVMLVLTLVSRVAPAADATHVDGSRDRYDLTQTADLLVDDSGSLTASDVSTREAAARFRPLEPRHLTFGYTSAAFWLRFRLTSERAGSMILALSRTPEIAELYAIRAGDAAPRLEARSGLSLPFDARPVQEPRIAFRIALERGDARTFYVRITSRDTVTLALSLDSEAAHDRARATTTLVDGVYYGILLGLIAYNLFVFTATRDRAYLFYVAFQASLLVLQLCIDKYAFQYAWPSHPTWAARAEQLFASSTAGLSIVFAREFLGRRTLPSRVLAAAAIPFALAAPLTEAPAYFDALGVYVVACVVGLSAMALAATKRSPNAPFFIGAWVLLLGGAVSAVLSAQGLIDADRGFALLKVGSAAEATLLALGLANRINVMRREHARDLERRVVERTRDLEAAQKKLLQQERLAVLGRLVAEVAHEVGNPLNFALGGAVDLASRVDDLTRAAERGEPLHKEALDDARASLGLVLSGNRRIKTIVDNLRSYVRSRDVKSEPTDLIAGIDATLALAKTAIDAAGVTVTRDLAPLPEVRCRPGEMSQVFMNLVLNCIGAMPCGGELRVSAWADAERMHVAFADTGRGVAPADRDRIFEPFFSSGDGTTGMGLGLWVSREIVARHGGDLRLETGDGAGATFIVELPLEPPESLKAG